MKHPVKHIPLKPARAGTPGEGIYLQLWQKFATDRPNEWRAIFRTNGPVRQRAASVAASFMVYMGCNGGASFTHEAERRAAAGGFLGSREYAFLAAWAIHNKRDRGINSGLRTIEYMLAREHPIYPDTYRCGRVNWRTVPDVTMEDTDIVESMVRWWASTTAEVMREQAEALVAAYWAGERAKQMELNHWDKQLPQHMERA